MNVKGAYSLTYSLTYKNTLICTEKEHVLFNLLNLITQHTSTTYSTKPHKSHTTSSNLHDSDSTTETLTTFTTPQQHTILQLHYIVIFKTQRSTNILFSKQSYLRMVHDVRRTHIILLNSLTESSTAKIAKGIKSKSHVQK